MPLTHDFTTLDNTQLDQLLARLTPEMAQGALSALQAEIRERCRLDGKYFLRFVSTRDEADPDAPVKLAPRHVYVGAIWDELANHNRVVIAKSRQMWVTWLLCAFAVWWARFKPNQAVYVQCTKAEDAWEKVAMPGPFNGRCQFIEHNLPDFLKVPVRESQGILAYHNGSIIQALPGGSDQIRGKTASVIIEDEFAYQPEARGVYAAVAPLIQKGAKFIACSTPNGSANCFAELFHGEGGT